MPHQHYYKIQAPNNYDLGYALGGLFKTESQQLVSCASQQKDWGKLVDRSQAYVEITKKYFPQYIEELIGYAKGADIEFIELWTRSLEGSLSDHCTTVVTNSGMLVGHNEDWEVGTEDQICILDITIGQVRILELYYYTTLGGNALSINSHGVIQAINSLAHTDHFIGVPRNVIARWISETSHLEGVDRKLHLIPRSSGYSHVLLNKEGSIWSLECSAREQSMIERLSPFVHTNHFLSKLQSLEANTNQTGSIDRYTAAQSLVHQSMSAEELQIVMNDQSHGAQTSIMNDRTIAKAVIDLQEGVIRIWLKREVDSGWISYPLL